MEGDFTPQLRALEEIFNSHYRDLRSAYRQQCMEKCDFPAGSDPDVVVDEALNGVNGVVFLPTSSPAYMTRGYKQAVLRLAGGLACKSANYMEFGESGDTLAIWSAPKHRPHASDTVGVLNRVLKLDPPLKAPVMVDFEAYGDGVTFRPGEDGFGTFMIVPDLTEGGRLSVTDILNPDGDFGRVINGHVLRTVYEGYVDTLNRLYTQCTGTGVDGLMADVDSHFKGKGPEGADDAIRRLFFLQIDPQSGTGRIIPGDHNNVYFYPRERGDLH